MHDAIDQALTSEGSIEFGFADGSTTRLEPVPVCVTRFELSGEGRRAVADGERVGRGDFRQEHGFDRGRQFEVQARIGGAGIFAEAQDNTILVRADLVPAAARNGEPDGHEDQQDQTEAERAATAAGTGLAASAATENSAQIALHLANDLIEIGRFLTAAAAAALRALPPGVLTISAAAGRGLAR